MFDYFTSRLSMENFYLCYECGGTLGSKNDFDEHVFVHQAVSLCYQLYEFEKDHSSGTGQKAKDESQSHISSIAERTQQIKPSSVTFRKAPDSLSKSVRKMPPPKRKLTDSPTTSDSFSKAPVAKQRKISQIDDKLGTAEKASPGMRSTESKSTGKTSATIFTPTKPLGDVSAGTVGISATTFTAFQNVQQMEAQKVIKSSNIDLSTATSTTTITTMTTATPTTTSLLTGQLGTTAAATTTTTATTVQDGTTATAKSSPDLPKCLLCDYRSSQGTDMVEHVVRLHQTSIICLEKTDFVDGKWTEKVKLEPRRDCAYCVRKFRESTDYFLHLIICHKRNLLPPGVSKYNCIVYLAHPGMPTHMVRIFMKRP